MSWDVPTKAPTANIPFEWSDVSGWVQGLVVGVGVLLNIGAIIYQFYKMRNVPTHDIPQMEYAKKFSSKMLIFSAIVFGIVMVVHIAEDSYFYWYLIFLIYWAYRYYYYWKKTQPPSNGLLQNSSIRSTTSTNTITVTQPNYPPHQPSHPQQFYPQIAVADIWKQWAGDFTNEMAVRNYMDRIQNQRGGPRIRLLKATMIANEGPCRNFLSSIHQDKWLFHGASEANASNIQSEGLLMRHASPGLLDRGLYGATDPRKAFFYSNYEVRHNGVQQNGYFMFLGRYNCQYARSGRGLFKGDPYDYEEFAVYDERHVVLLWHLKVTQDSW